MKYGKVSKEELLMDSCSFFPEATSMILGEVGALRFNYNSDNGWNYLLDITIRKKIFELVDKDQANIKIRVYSPVNGSSEESIGSLKATTYNLVDGKVEKTKLPNSEKFVTRLSDYMVEYSFALPEVKEGSVIEYKYVLSSDFYSTLKTWYFQNDIPTAYSKLSVTIPEFFNYQVSQVGNVVEVDFKEQDVNETFTYTWSTAGQGGELQRGTSTLESNSKNTTITARNIIPIEEEPHQNNKSDLISRVEFQLVSIQYPQRPIELIASNYEKFNKQILDWSNFGNVLKKGGFAKSYINTIQNEDELSRAVSVYNWLMTNSTWNEVYGFTGSDAGRQTINGEPNKVGDINLSLVAALREAGLNADPVILSTRGHGTVHPVFPNMDDFNYVIAIVDTENGSYLLDATSNLPFGMLPRRCLNGNGWRASEGGGSWVNLKNAEYKKMIGCDISFDEESMNSHFHVNADGHSAISIYNSVARDDVEEYASSLEENFLDATLNNFNYPDTNKVNHVELSFDLERDFDQEEIIYLPIVDYENLKENPFKRETRKSPIDFSYKQSIIYLTKIHVPEGYKATLPEQQSVALPENGGVFLFSATQMNDEITVYSKINVSKTLFTAAEYPGLRQFYQLVADKHNEMIILKKSL
ncbi:MAG: DUF3858 domain-containing protein [Cyclobacteriaceae bacterium]